MKIFLLGKGASITHWLEDAAAAFTAEGHGVTVGLVRRPWLAAPLEAGLVGPIAAALCRRIRRAAPDLILVIGGFHAPLEILHAVAALPGRPPMIGWVGDRFEAEALDLARTFDAVGYTDSGLLARHQALDFPSRAFYLPHAANPAGDWPSRARRAARMIFIANPTPHRRQVIRAIEPGVVLYGPGWTSAEGAQHQIHAHRAPPGALRGLYGGHLAALNIRNEANVLAGLNQRNFDPLLAGAALLTDDQPDLARCFEPGVEVLVWRTTDELKGAYERLLAHPQTAAALAARGRRRVLADHTYGARLKTLAALL
jgi:spore maturation protein CgeB